MLGTVGLPVALCTSGADEGPIRGKLGWSMAAMLERGTSWCSVEEESRLHSGIDPGLIHTLTTSPAGRKPLILPCVRGSAPMPANHDTKELDRVLDTREVLYRSQCTGWQVGSALRRPTAVPPGKAHALASVSCTASAFGTQMSRDAARGWRSADSCCIDLSGCMLSGCSRWQSCPTSNGTSGPADGNFTYEWWRDVNGSIAEVRRAPALVHKTTHAWENSSAW